MGGRKHPQGSQNHRNRHSTAVNSFVMSWTLLVTFPLVHLMLWLIDENLHTFCMFVSLLYHQLSYYYSMLTGTFCCNYFKNNPGFSDTNEDMHANTHNYTHTRRRSRFQVYGVTKDCLFSPSMRLEKVHYGRREQGRKMRKGDLLGRFVGGVSL